MFAREHSMMLGDDGAGNSTQTRSPPGDLLRGRMVLFFRQLELVSLNGFGSHNGSGS